MTPRHGIAEYLGTFFLLLVVVGSGIVVVQLGSDGTGQLFAHSVMVGLGLAVLIAFLATVSDAHFNPVVTLAFWRRGDISAAVAGRYLLAQVAGAVTGTGAAHLCFGNQIWSVATNERGGWGRIASELIGTFALVLVILVLYESGRSTWIPAAAGAWVTVMIFSTPSTGFLNPAVTIARMFTDTYTGISPAHAPGFIAAQMTGAVLASSISNRLFPKSPGKGT